MATYHCSIKHGSKGNGASGKAKSDYICREGKYADKPDLQYKESGNMPEWVEKQPRNFWKASDKHERANGRVYTEVEVALPRDYSLEDHKALVQGFVREQLPGQPYTFAIHNPKAALDGEEQPHAHIIFSERKLDGIERDKEQFFKRANAKEPEKGGCAKDRKWNDRNKVQAVREAWEHHHNKAVEWDVDMVSCKSLKAQGVDREPESHLGPKMTRSLEAEKIKETRRNTQELQQINREMQSLTKEIEAEQQVKPTPQDIVIEPQPPKADNIPASEPKAEKIQEVAQTPDTTRPADRDQLQDKPVTTISSPTVAVEPTQSEALPLGNKSFIQQPACKPELQSVTPNPVVEPPASAFTTAELAYHVVLRRIAAISRNFISLYNALTDGTLLGGVEKYNDRTEQLEAELKKLTAPYSGTQIGLPYDDTPIMVNGEPITKIVEGLPPKPEQPKHVSPTQVQKR